jgi:hypothetical protein
MVQVHASSFKCVGSTDTEVCTTAAFADRYSVLISGFCSSAMVEQHAAAGSPDADSIPAACSRHTTN